MSQTRWAGICMIFAAVTFWLAWFLMPDAGTADAAHILDAVRSHRESVRWSIIVQIISSAAFVPAVVFATFHTVRARIGAILVLIGAMGMAMDAIYHLAAYYMTADGVTTEAVLEPMRLMQSDGLKFLVPLLPPFLFGGWVFASGLRLEGRASRWPGWIFASAFIFALVGGLLVATVSADRRMVVLGFLGLIAIGYGSVGLDRIRFRDRQPEEGQQS
jgi:hypothetical protein